MAAIMDKVAEMATVGRCVATKMSYPTFACELQPRRWDVPKLSGGHCTDVRIKARSEQDRSKGAMNRSSKAGAATEAGTRVKLSYCIKKPAAMML